MIEKQGVKIIGIGSFSPDFAVNNADFSKFIETDDEWITSRTGIKTRHFNIGGTNLDMAVKAAERALESASVNSESIDMIIACTATPDYLYPSLSCLMQNKIGAVNAFAVDISVACTGFINALDIAHSYLS